MKGRDAGAGLPGPDPTTPWSLHLVAFIYYFLQQLVLTLHEAFQSYRAYLRHLQVLFGDLKNTRRYSQLIRRQEFIGMNEGGVKESSLHYVPHAPLYKLSHLVKALSTAL